MRLSEDGSPGGLSAVVSSTNFCHFNAIGNISSDMHASNNSALMSGLDFTVSLRLIGILFRPEALLSPILS